MLGRGDSVLIAGPCVIESETHALELGRRIAAVARKARVPYIFKASFDKANRTSASSYRGPGLDEGLAILGRIRKELGVPVLTDIHEASQAERGGRGRRRAADSCVPVAADGPDRRGSARPVGPSTSRRASFSRRST